MSQFGLNNIDFLNLNLNLLFSQLFWYSKLRSKPKLVFMASTSIPSLVSPPSSPLPQPTPSMSAMNASSKNFAHSISQKLNMKNYLLWILQVEPVICSHHLEGYIVSPKIPQKYASIEDRNADKVTSEYSVWYEQDQFLLAWLQSTISSDILL